MHDDFSYDVYNVGEMMVFCCAPLSVYGVLVSIRLYGANNILKLITNLPLVLNNKHSGEILSLASPPQ